MLLLHWLDVHLNGHEEINDKVAFLSPVDLLMLPHLHHLLAGIEAEAARTLASPMLFPSCRNLL